jgi:hypothetical protein
MILNSQTQIAHSAIRQSQNHFAANHFTVTGGLPAGQMAGCFLAIFSVGQWRCRILGMNRPAAAGFPPDVHGVLITRASALARYLESHSLELGLRLVDGLKIGPRFEHAIEALQLRTGVRPAPEPPLPAHS